MQDLHGLSDHAMLDMGDFAGGMLKYLAKNPVPRITVGGGIGKMTKLAQGAVDLHSGRSRVDFEALATWMDDPALRDVNTALEAYTIAGPPLAETVAARALAHVERLVPESIIDIVVIDRAGAVLARAGG